jgi:YidC/Oxa1 family membrane protein insertase
LHIFSSTFTQILGNLVQLTGDWFFAIALVTFSIKLVLFPLSVKQQRTQLLTLHLNQAKALLAKKFENKTEKINSELLKIVTKYNINPLSSFLTLFVQAPVFFSLYYSVINLSTSVGSILVPWVASLQTIDNLHILPVVAGLFQGLSGFTMENKNLLIFLLPVSLESYFSGKRLLPSVLTGL